MGEYRDRGNAPEPVDPTMAPERLLLFSDAVVAIAITLLALELPAPHGVTTHEFLTSLRHNREHYFAFTLTFVVIAAAWVQHRRIWSFADRFDSRQLVVNMVWLFTIVLFPFATSALRGEPGQSVTVHAYRFGFYSLLEVVDDAAILFTARRMVTASLYRAGVTPRQIAEASWPCIGAVLGFGLSIPVFFATTYGWVLWIVGPVAANLYRRYRIR